MIHSVLIRKSAQKNLARIPERDQDRIIQAIRSLAQAPRPNSPVWLAKADEDWLSIRNKLAAATALRYLSGEMKAKSVLAGQILVLYLKEGETFVAFSPVLDLSSCGRTFEEADKNFGEALHLFFSECMRRDTLEKTLIECGRTHA